MWKTLAKLIKPHLITWLDQRALRLPESDKRALAAKLKVEVEVINAVEQHLRDCVIALIRGL